MSSKPKPKAVRQTSTGTPSRSSSVKSTGTSDSSGSDIRRKALTKKEQPIEDGGQVRDSCGGRAAPFEAASRRNILEEVMVSTTPSSPIAAVSETANRLYQDSKEQLEGLSNIKREVRDVVIGNMGALYEITLRLGESRNALEKRIEEQKTNHAREMYRREVAYSAKLESLAGTVQGGNLSEQVEKLQKEIESLKSMIAFDIGDAMEKCRLSSLGKPNDLTQLNKKLTDIETMMVKASQAKAVENESTAEGHLELQELSATMTDTHNLVKVIYDRSEVKCAESTVKPPTEGVALKMGPLTYAGAAARAPVKTSHAIIVSSEKQEDSSDAVLNKIREAVDARNTGVCVDSVRRVRNQKVVLTCGNREDVEDITKRITAKPGLKVEKARTKDPTVIVWDVMSTLTNDEVTGAIKLQNKTLFNDLSSEDDRMEVRFRRKARNPHLNHVVLRVSPRLWRRMVEVGSAHIDLMKSKVADFSPLVQCSRCLGFGHGRRTCAESADICSHCSGQHLKSECPDYGLGHKPCCVNCKNAKQERLDHGAFSDDCPVKRKWDAIARLSVAYC